MNQVNMLWIIVPLATALLGLAIFGWQREMQQRQASAEAAEAARRAEAERDAARRAPLPAGGVGIRSSAANSTADRSGRIMLVIVGTFGTGLGLAVLRWLDRCGLAHAIGSILLIELDDNQRTSFLGSVPAVFQDRIVAVRFGGLSGGLANRGPEEVRALSRVWGPALRHGVADVAQLHQRLQHAAPALTLTLTSTGGQALLGVVAIEELRKVFSESRYYGYTILPVDGLLREHVRAILDAYHRAGVIGFIIADNLLDEVRNDFGMAAGIVGLIASSSDADAAVEFNNALTLLFERAPGHLATFSTAVRQLPGHRFQPHPEVEPRYYVQHDLLLSTARSVLAAVQQTEDTALGNLRDLGQDQAPPLTSRFELVLTAVRPDDLKAVEDDLVLGEQGFKGVSKRDYHLLVTSIATTIDPEAPLCPVAAVALRALPDGDRALAILTQPTYQVQLAAPATVAELPNTVPSSNGRSVTNVAP